MNEQDEIDAISDLAKNVMRAEREGKIGKCRGCFAESWITCFAEALGVDQKDCHLTPDTKRFIGAMLRGVFDCGHCKFESEGGSYFDGCEFRYTSASMIEKKDWFCPEWQERKGEEDG
jgi:hypothetical protein